MSDIEPVVRIAPGDAVTAETDDFAGGQITQASTAADLPGLDFDLIYPLAGPIHVEGAEPGDALAVEFLEFELPEWGWACIIPGLGLLPPGEFDRAAPEALRPHQPAHHGVRAGRDAADRAVLRHDRACRAPGCTACRSRRRTRAAATSTAATLTPGTTLYLPVGVSGGLLSLGDAHAAQGDGEVCDLGHRVRDANDDPDHGRARHGPARAGAAAPGRAR